MDIELESSSEISGSLSPESYLDNEKLLATFQEVEYGGFHAGVA